MIRRLVWRILRSAQQRTPGAGESLADEKFDRVRLTRARWSSGGYPDETSVDEAGVPRLPFLTQLLLATSTLATIFIAVVHLPPLVFAGMSPTQPLFPAPVA